MVELAGRIDMQVWNDKEGNAKGALTMHVSNIKLLGGVKGQLAAKEQSVMHPAAATEDLPF